MSERFESPRSREERLKRERYELFDRLVDQAGEGAMNAETAISIYRDLKPAGLTEPLEGMQHLHTLDASTGEEWCLDCATYARYCEGGAATH